MRKTSEVCRFSSSFFSSSPIGDRVAHGALMNDSKGKVVGGEVKAKAGGRGSRKRGGLLKTAHRLLCLLQ